MFQLITKAFGKALFARLGLATLVESDGNAITIGEHWFRATRTITSKPRRGATIPVEVDTHAVGVLQFTSGAVVQLSMSFDVAAHRHLPLEIYGTEGTQIVPNPNWFGDQIELANAAGRWRPVKTTMPYADDNYRSLGIADMAHAIRSRRPHRASRVEAPARGKGRVFYSSLGHVSREFEVPQMRTILHRGMLWAARDQ